MDVTRNSRGQPTYYYSTADQRGFQAAEMSGPCIEAISDHIEKHLGPIDGVFHEILSDKVHIDLHSVAPSERLPFQLLVTSGMSDLPMTSPPGREDYRYAELMLWLPASWNLDLLRGGSCDDPELSYWPIRQLKILASFPHQFGTWLWWGHTVPNGHPHPAPYHPSTQLSCTMLMPSLLAPPEFRQLEISPDKVINFFSVIFLHEDEMNLKLKTTAIDVMERITAKGGISAAEVLNLRRLNSMKSWWKFW